MGRYINILHGASRVWAGAPPDTATMILAILERPESLVVIGLWVVGKLLEHTFISLVLRILGVCVWPALPAPVRRFLLHARDHFLPGAAHRSEGMMPTVAEGGRERFEDPPQSAAELVDALRHLERQLGRAEARAELSERAESTIREERDWLLRKLEEERSERRRLQAELDEARRPWWQRLFRG